MSRGYVHAEADFGTEFERLRLLETQCDPRTFRRLGVAGPLDGARCLEVGAGAGSVARWLTQQVGSDGWVVATDADPRFLDGLSAANLEVRRHDILTDDLEPGAYDLAHCRALLLHLSRPEVALEHMVAALRPGGWLVVEDADFVSLAAADPRHPLSAVFDRVVQEKLALIRSKTQFDPFFGRRLPGLVAELGLADGGHEVIADLRRGATPGAKLVFRSGGWTEAEMLRSGRLAQEDLRQWRAVLLDPFFSFLGALSVAAWGRRPD